MDSLRGIVDKGPYICMCKKWFLEGNSTQNKKYPPIEIANAHIHTPRNNSAKFHDNPLDTLGVANNRFWMDGQTDGWTDGPPD